jgi:biopolymer transport protein ExbD
MNKPNVNVTPLIDVLLVLLIIFMVIAPLKPNSFKARVPPEPQNVPIIDTHPDTLVASIEKDGSLRLNKESDVGTADDPAKLIERLRAVFVQRIANGNVSGSFADDPDRPTADRVERTVFIRAARSAGYGDVAKLIDAVKTAGAYPIGLQIDDLE